jgi:predicted anti-sigma-YlaC factor YlaD
MSCDEFERRLEQLLEGRIAAADHERCVRHAATCDRCRELVAPMGRSLIPVAVKPPASFRSSVIRMTSGTSRRSRWAATWREWVLRPRFASEVAYVGVVMLTLVCAAVDRSTLAHYRSEAGILLDRATSLLEKEKP